MRIAVVGSGIGGLSAAWLLSRRHEVVLYEANDYLGGHADTHRIELDGRALDVDTGFIVHNPAHYPLLTRMFDELGVESQQTTMSFSVQDAASGLEYNATSLDALFCQRRNLASPRFWGMLRDLARFYRDAPALLEGEAPGPTLGEYLAAGRYGSAFRDLHLVPMASALWSSPAAAILEFPAGYLVRFMANHQMLQVAGRPQWRVVRGGSRRYVEALAARWKLRKRLSTPVRGVVRNAHAAIVRCDEGSERFDQVVLACHSDQALALLDDASDPERDILGAIRYQANEAVLHTDARLLPRDRKLWSAWNYFAGSGDPGEQPVGVSYLINRLQPLPFDTPVVVTLNPAREPDPAKVIAEFDYDHPIFDASAIAAQQRLADDRLGIQGEGGVWLAGAWGRFGFHEDGLRSALRVANLMGIAAPWQTVPASLSPAVARA